mmetsp:Transcript_35481/g.91210  ORF Transcript_35481/g.91210 Transcript_35481/m.91210 type:complete len:400 (-) Transcript_35481:1409-2608(-)
MCSGESLWHSCSTLTVCCARPCARPTSASRTVCCLALRGSATSAREATLEQTRAQAADAARHGLSGGVGITCSVFVLVLIIVEDVRWRARARHHGVGACVVVILLATQVQVPVNHDVLLHLEHRHALRHGGQQQAQDEAGDDHRMLNEKEQDDLLRTLPARVLIGGEDHDRGVRRHGQDAEDVEGCVPRLVVGRGLGEGAAEEEHQLLLVKEALEEAADQGQQGHPGAGDDEERRVAVEDENLVHVLVHIVLVPLGLPLSIGQVWHDRQRVREHRRLEGAALPVAAVHLREVGQGQLAEVLQRHLDDHEDRQLGAEVVEAVVPHALHAHAEQRGVVLEEGNVVQGDVAVHELEDHRLGQEVVLVLRVGAVVLPVREPLSHLCEHDVQQLHDNGVQDHEE